MLSTFHYINHGGSEFVVFRVTPEDVQSGVRVGDKEYPGFPATGAGIDGDPALRVAFFALLLRPADRDTPIEVFARDVAGQQVVVPLDYMVFPKPYQQEPHRGRRPFPSARRPGDRGGTAPDEQIPTDDVLAGIPRRSTATCGRRTIRTLRDLAKKTRPR